jgi:ectoine hydroxylase-related dioxygenase (phytanoyl-CoA dioxygenase family)
VRHPKLLAVVRDLLGPNLRIHDAKLNWQPPAGPGGAGKGGFGWDQDFPFFPHSNTSLLACLFFLDDSTVENGCVRVIPASHKRGPVTHFADGQFTGVATDPRDYADEDRAVGLVVKAGTMTMHHTFALHASYPNTTAISRRALVCDIAAADAALLGGNMHRIWGTMLLGEDPLVARLESGPTYKLPRRHTNVGGLEPSGDWKTAQED